MRPIDRLLRCACAFALLGLTACATFRGAPAPLFDYQRLEQATAFQPDTLAEELANAGSVPERNAAIRKLLAASDFRYLDFRHDLVANRKHSLAAANGLLLAIDVASTLTESAGVKANYIALSSLVHGGENVFDKEYLFDRTLDALVTQMDANRKSKLVEITVAMGRSLEDYPGHVALADVVDYYQAGTLNAAFVGLQRNANAQEAGDTERLRKLEAISDEDLATRQTGTTRMSHFVDTLSPADLDVLRGFLAGKGITAAPGATEGETRANLKHGLTKLRSTSYASLDPLVAELQAANLTVP
jgi:hypothetical protein